MKKSEVWKDIKGYEGLYQISNLGRVKSLPKYIGFYYKQETILKNAKNNMGYIILTLSVQNKSKTFYLHRLMAQAFIPNPESKPCVNHIDGNKSNNNVSNLEWVTQSENEKHAHKIGLKNNKGENCPTCKLKNEQVLEIYKLAHSGKYKQKEIAKMFNISISHIQQIKYKTRWLHLLKDL